MSPFSKRLGRGINQNEGEATLGAKTNKRLDYNIIGK